MNTRQLITDLDAYREALLTVEPQTEAEAAEHDRVYLAVMIVLERLETTKERP